MLALKMTAIDSVRALYREDLKDCVEAQARVAAAAAAAAAALFVDICVC